MQSNCKLKRLISKEDEGSKTTTAAFSFFVNDIFVFVKHSL